MSTGDGTDDVVDRLRADLATRREAALFYGLETDPVPDWDRILQAAKERFAWQYDLSSDDATWDAIGEKFARALLHRRNRYWFTRFLLKTLSRLKLVGPFDEAVFEKSSLNRLKQGAARKLKMNNAGNASWTEIFERRLKQMFNAPGAGA